MDEERKLLCEYIENLTINDYEKLRTILSEFGVTNLWELREGNINYEIELSILELYYNGEEGYWCDETFEWVIYASHESSITFAGSILPKIIDNWENWEKRIWDSPFFD